MLVRGRNVLLTLVAAIATASLPLTSWADGKGLMLGGGIYYATINESENIEDIRIKFDDSSAAYNLDIGWRFNKWIGVDLGYWGLGEYKADDSDFKTDTSAVTLGVLASIPVWIIDIYGRGGAAWWEASNKNFDNDDGTDPYYGLGLAFNLGGSLDIYGEWVRFDLNTNYDTFGIGVRWTF